MGESVVRQLAVLRLPGSSYFKALLGIAVVSRAWAKAMTGLHSWAEVRLLWVSRSLQDKEFSIQEFSIQYTRKGFLQQKYLG